MIPQSHQPDQRGTALFSGDTLRKLATESSTSRCALVALTLAVAGIAALGVAGWIANVAVLTPVESLPVGSPLPARPIEFFFLLFVGIFGALGAFVGGLNALQTTVCLLWQRAQPHTERGVSRDVGHERRGSDAEEGG